MERPAPGAPTHRARRRLVASLVVLSCLATFVSSVAVWSRSVLLDTDAWVEAVGPLSDNPDVTRALATYLVDQAAAAVDLEQVAADALPGRSRVLAAPLSNAIRSFLTDQADEVLQSERFGTLWVEANRRAHGAAVRLLRGEPGAVAASGGVVRLNLVPALAWLLQRADAAGLLPDGVAAPDIGFEVPADEAVRSLSEALGRDLPADFAQVQVFDSQALAQAQDAVAIFERLVSTTVALTVVLIFACLALSLDRRRTLVAVALATAAALVASSAVITATGDYALRLITDEVDRSAAAAIVRQIVSSLQEIQHLLALVGVAIALAAYLVGPSERAERWRASLRRHRPSPDDADDSEAEVPAPWRVAVARHRDALRMGGLLAALAAVVAIDPTFRSLGRIAISLVAFQLAVTVVGGRSTEAELAATRSDNQR